LNAVPNAGPHQGSQCFRWSLADCKSAIVGSTPTGASYQKTPLVPQYSQGNAGFFRFCPGDGLGSLMAPFRTTPNTGHFRKPCRFSSRFSLFRRLGEHPRMRSIAAASIAGINDGSGLRSI